MCTKSHGVTSRQNLFLGHILLTAGFASFSCLQPLKQEVIKAGLERECLKKRNLQQACEMISCVPVIFVLCIPGTEILQGGQKVSVHLTMAMTEYIRNADRAILNTVFENTVRRVNKCLENGRGHSGYYL